MTSSITTRFLKTLGVASLAIAGLATLSLSPAPPARAAGAEKCGSQGNLTLLCGPLGVEDMRQISGTPWIVGSGMGRNGKDGGLNLIDARNKTWSKLYPGPSARNEQDKTDFFRCPGPPDPAKFVAHGIALKKTGPDAYRILAINHGGRESVEVFTLSTKAARPAVTWIGCVVMPKDIYMNSVTFLPKDGFAFTKFFDPTNPMGFNSIFTGNKTGAVYEWHTQLGITKVPGTDLDGANGIAVSKDGKWYYVAAWGSHEIVRFRRGTDEREKKTVKVGFSPDNMQWAPDGSILVAGQDSTPNPEAPAPDFAGWTVLKLNPETMKTTKIASGDKESIIQDVSNAIDVDGTLWLGAYQGDKVGYMPMP
ncbi:MAG TPA: SMP-30/gluconolactonase/LRE family protein [Alphaproteobacteria bacterium]|nr:SMP-30/gluconolactonase/LRE family protein [Alphaproteobacteria bacterium]